MRIKLRQIAHALAVSRHGSFRRAAEEQHLSQPALSRSIRNLEQALGVPLFERNSTELGLTPYGEAFLLRAEGILADATELERDIIQMRNPDVATFSVGMGTMAAQMTGVRAAAELLRDHPGLQARMEIGRWGDVEQRVRDGQLNVGFSEIGHLRDAPDLRVEPVGRHEMVFYCRPGHPLLACGNALSAALLDEYPFTGIPIPFRPADRFPHRRRLDGPAGSEGLPTMMEDISAACAIVSCTDTLAAAPPLLIEPWIRTGKLAVLPFRRPWLRLDYGFIMPGPHTAPGGVELFKEKARTLELEVAQRNHALLEEFVGACDLSASSPAAVSQSNNRSSRSISAGVQPACAVNASQARR